MGVWKKISVIKKNMFIRVHIMFEIAKNKKK